MFKTTDGGKHFLNISGNLPDLPVNSVILDPSYPNTLYVGTDVGAYVTYDGGGELVAARRRTCRTSRSGRWTSNTTDTKRFLARRHARAWRVPHRRSVGLRFRRSSSRRSTRAFRSAPSSRVDYTLTLKNIGNADATGVTITDPIPANTSFMSADNGGKLVTDKNGKNPRSSGRA